VSTDVWGSEGWSGVIVDDDDERVRDVELVGDVAFVLHFVVLRWVVLVWNGAFVVEFVRTFLGWWVVFDDGVCERVVFERVVELRVDRVGRADASVAVPARMRVESFMVSYVVLSRKVEGALYS